MKLLFLCIGSEKISGDCIGPIVGTLLKEKYKIPYPVFGTEENSVNGKNVSEYVRLIKEYFPAHKIIAVDAAVGEEKDLWTLKYRVGGVRAGGAINADSEYVGEVGILAVVGRKKGDVLENLLAAPYLKVNEFAERIARTIVKTFAPKCIADGAR